MPTPEELIGDTDVFTKDIDNPAAAELREMLDSQDYVFAPGMYHALDARLAEMAGHDAAYMSGYSTVLDHPLRVLDHLGHRDHLQIGEPELAEDCGVPAHVRGVVARHLRESRVESVVHARREHEVLTV